MLRNVRAFAAHLAVAVVAITATSANADARLTDAEARDIAEDAYVFGFPIVMSYKTWFFFFLHEENPQFVAPMNTLKNFPRVKTHRDTIVVSPNSDTPYSFLGLDLRAEPMVISVPEIPEDRFYSVHLADINHHNFGFLGTANTGNGAGHHMIAGPGWSGPKPDGIDTVTTADAHIAFAVFRTQLFSPSDLPNVKAIQEQYRAQPLSSFLGEAPAAAAPRIDFPAWDETALHENFIPLLNFMLQFTTPTPDEAAIRARMAKIGIGPGKPFDWAALSDAKRDAIEAGFAAARAGIAANEAVATEFLFGSRARIDGDWMARAVAVEGAQWGKDREQAILPRLGVDKYGDPFDARKASYTITFPKGDLPPARAFWSLTMYDGETGFLVKNPLDRYLINSPMLPDLEFNDDGSLTLYIQHGSPGVDKESNWLPAPDGPFYMIMRLYWPEPAVLDGTWAPPPVVPVGGRTSRTLDDAMITDAYVYLLARALIVRQEHIDIGAEDVDYNMVHHNELASAVFVNPNMSVTNSEAWIAVDDETPVLLEIPKVEGRYYTAQIVDEWGEVITNINDRNYPLQPYGRFAFVAPGSRVDVPDDAVRIELRSQKAKMLARVELQDDPAGAVALQHQITMRPLGSPAFPPAVELPMFDNEALLGVEIFDAAEEMLKSAPDVSPIAAQMQAKVRAVARIATDPQRRSALDAFLRETVVPEFRWFAVTEAGATRNNWLGTLVIGNYGEEFRVRSAANLVGIWANNTHEVIYFVTTRDANGDQLNGDRDYIMHFPADALPESVVNWFWSVTLVGLPDFLPVSNRLDRFSLGTFSGLQKEPDGSLKILVASEPGAGVPESNWLPTAAGQPFSLTFRTYVPKEAVTSGAWFPAAISPQNRK